jgi:hypothetical protein
MGLSGHGKTSYAINLIFDIDELNENTDVIMFSLENPSKDIIAKRISTYTNTSVKDMDLNPNIVIDENLFTKMQSCNIKFIEETGNNEQIYLYLDNYLSEVTDKDVVVFFDHALLIDEENDNLKISNLARNCIKLKNRYKNFTCFILSQLNDSITDPIRVNGSNPFPSYQDGYNARQLFQASDTVMAIVKPGSFIQNGSSLYGGVLPIYCNTNNKIYNMIYGHFIKGRFSGTNVIAWLDDLEFNRLIELDYLPNKNSLINGDAIIKNTLIKK